MTSSVCYTYCPTAKHTTTSSRGLGRRIHGSVEDTKLSTNKQHSLTRMGLLDPSPKAFKQRRGTYFYYYNRAAIGLACAQATAMRIDIAPHKRPLKKLPQHVPDPHLFTHIPSHALLHD